jgi:Na+/H+-translocating membrane pyrophosphatase
VIADLVGDNVGDCAGRGADLFESIAAEILGAMILAGQLATDAGEIGIVHDRAMLLTDRSQVLNRADCCSFRLLYTRWIAL